ncbi:hypothetical protein Tco_0221730 [Tanacetum coccineum]
MHCLASWDELVGECGNACQAMTSPLLSLPLASSVSACGENWKWYWSWLVWVYTARAAWLGARKREEEAGSLFPELFWRGRSVTVQR